MSEGIGQYPHFLSCRNATCEVGEMIAFGSEIWECGKLDGDLARRYVDNWFNLRCRYLI